MESRYYNHTLLELLGNVETTRPVLSVLRTLKPDCFLSITEFLIVETTQGFQLQVLCVFYYIKLFSFRHWSKIIKRDVKNILTNIYISGGKWHYFIMREEYWMIKMFYCMKMRERQFQWPNNKDTKDNLDHLDPSSFILYSFDTSIPSINPIKS